MFCGNWAQYNYICLWPETLSSAQVSCPSCFPFAASWVMDQCPLLPWRGCFCAVSLHPASLLPPPVHEQGQALPQTQVLGSLCVAWELVHRQSTLRFIYISNCCQAHMQVIFQKPFNILLEYWWVLEYWWSQNSLLSSSHVFFHTWKIKKLATPQKLLLRFAQFRLSIICNYWQIYFWDLKVLLFLFSVLFSHITAE